MYKKLHVFAGAKHPHAAQQPKKLELRNRKNARYCKAELRHRPSQTAAARVYMKAGTGKITV
jgi:hypothetical protein